MSAMLLYADGTRVELTLGGVVIGRGQDCGVRSDDPLISRRNARVSFSSGRWCVEDLGSSNGTFVNGERVQRQALQEGDVIGCGELRLRFSLLHEETQPPQPVTLQQQDLPARLAELEQTGNHQRDELRALTALLTELKAELQTLTAAHEELRGRAAELEEDLQARTRQLERAHEDVERQQKEAEQARAELAEARRVADEGWSKLKATNAEMDKMRRVMGQQEELLDQRRMGLSALEQAVQGLRAEREKMLAAQVALAHERDELRRALEARQPAAYAHTVELRGTG